MAAYLIVDVQVLDAEKYKEYVRLSTLAMAAHGGEFLARGGQVTVFEGTWHPTRLVIARFPSVEAAQGWYASPEYGAARAARDGAAIMQMLVVQGVS